MKRKNINNWLLMPVVAALAAISVSPVAMSANTVFYSGVGDESIWPHVYDTYPWNTNSWPQMNLPGAYWIWPNGGSSWPNHGDGYPGDEVHDYTRNIYIDGSPTSGSLIITCDNGYTVKINGNTIGSDGEWTHLKEYNVLSSLHAGMNTLDVHAINWGGPGGLIYKLDVYYASAPVAGNDVYSTAEDTALTVPARGVLVTDSDAENDPLTAILVSSPSHGSLILDPVGSFTYIPDANYNGDDSFTYKANDGHSDSNVATVSITVNPINDAPVTVNDAYSTAEDTALTVPAKGVLANDNDVDGDALTASLSTVPSHGTITLSSDGSFIYRPDANYYGQDSFKYKASDSKSDSNEATVTVTVGPVNDVPAAGNDQYTATEDIALDVPANGVLANDVDADGDMLSVSLSTQPSNGVVTLNPDGSFKYTPDTNYNGEDIFTYEVSDGNGGIASATVAITIDPVNDCPEVVDDVAVVDEDNSVDINVVANDIDVDVDDAISIDSFTQPGNGIVTQKEDGTLTYEPDENFCSEDSFTYKATDGYCESNEVTVTITVNPVNDVPVADDDQYTATEDIALEVPANGVLGNDVDADGDMLSVSLSTQPSNGVVTLNPDGSFKYKPDTNYNGEDSFTYEVSDGNGGIASTAVAITIDPVNDAPVAKGDSYSTDEDTVLQVAAPGVLGTDSDADGDVLMAILVSDTSQGSLELNDDGSFTYEPGDNYNGADSFTYKVSDDELESDVATVTITVNPVNDAPEATEDSYSTDEDTPLTVDAPGVLANDKDEVEGDSLTASMATEPSQGTLTLNPDGSFIYTPEANYNGEDSFTYKANDGQDDSNIASVDITIKSVNDAPVAVDDSGTTDENTAVDIDVLANDVDNDLDYGDALTIASIATPAHGVAKIEDGAVTYTPNLWYSGEDSFQYTITDTTSLTATATVTITINDVIPSTDDICAFIQELPDNAFDKDASNQKKTFCNKLAAIGKQIANKEYRGAIEKLENDIRSKADGGLGGDKKNDWITDPDAQDELCNMIDILLDALNAL